MDLKFLVSVIGLLAGIWLYLHKTITDLTVTSPAHPTLLMLGYAHFTVLGYISIALHELYYMGATASSAATGPSVLTTFFLLTWPIALVCLVLSFLLAKASDGDLASNAFIIAVALVCPSVLVYQATQGQDVKYLIIVAICIIVGIPIFGTLYIVLMSYFLADVEITTDKQFYTDRDNVIICVRAGGYMLRPAIVSVKFGSYEKPLGDKALVIRPEEHVGSDLIQVEYLPQVIGRKRESTHWIKMAKTPA